MWGDRPESEHPSWRRTMLLVFAITLHNFPEGLAVGVAFGAVSVIYLIYPIYLSDLSNLTLPQVESAENKQKAFSNAVALAIGIGIQDFPEGLGVSMPLRRAGMSRFRSFI